jgi:DNA-binding GntR family transcriptional regulator
MKQLTRLTLKDKAKKAIRELISQSRFLPGSRVNADFLSKQLGVSRTPVSKALAELEEEGLLERHANKGYVMTQMSSEMASELYFVRGHLEVLSVKLATQNISTESIELLKKKAEEQKEIVDGGDLLAYSQTTFEFHDIVYKSSGNWALYEVLSLLAERARPFSIDLTTILKELYQDHLDLIKAFENRDTEKAVEITVNHTNRVAKLISSSS